MLCIEPLWPPDEPYHLTWVLLEKSWSIENLCLQVTPPGTCSHRWVRQTSKLQFMCYLSSFQASSKWLNPMQLSPAKKCLMHITMTNVPWMCERQVWLSPIKDTRWTVLVWWGHHTVWQIGCPATKRTLGAAAAPVTLEMALGVLLVFIKENRLGFHNQTEWSVSSHFLFDQALSTTNCCLESWARDYATLGKSLVMHVIVRSSCLYFVLISNLWFPNVMKWDFIVLPHNIQMRWWKNEIEEYQNTWPTYGAELLRQLFALNLLANIQRCRGNKEMEKWGGLKYI